MKITEADISALRSDVKKYMSEKRYEHTLGVEAAAIRIGEYCLPDKIIPLRCAALLHDISKELSADEQTEILREVKGITVSDLLTPPAHHAFTAPTVILRDFPSFATKEILSAVFNHTTASADMSVFDEIVFIADYVEDGRTYTDCIKVRDELFKRLEEARDIEECVQWLHVATISTLNNTINSLKSRNRFINDRTLSAKEAFISRMPMSPELSDN